MPHFSKGGGDFAPFGRNEYLRSTKPKPRTESYTVAFASVPTLTVDGLPRKILQPGTVMAKITSGADAGKVGPFQAGVSDGRQTLANIVGLNDTFLPWQLFDRDEQIGVAYDATEAVQAWCIEYNSSGVPIALTNTTRDSMVAGNTKGKIFFS